jgi:CheY-like chemotaxis protein
MLQKGARPRLDGIRVLVVDDEPDICDVTAWLLKSYGAVVEAAPSAAVARARIAARPFDVLLCDLNMPGEDGLSLLRSIRAAPNDYRAIPAAAVTARGGARHEATQAGFDRVLGKPFETAAMVDTVLELSQLAR